MMGDGKTNTNNSFIMKKTILIFLVIILSFNMVAGCKQQDEIVSDGMEGIYDFESLEALSAAIQVAQQKQTRGEPLNEQETVLAKYKQIPYPDIDLSQYYLYRVRIADEAVMYDYYSYKTNGEYVIDENGNRTRDVVLYSFNCEDHGAIDVFAGIKTEYAQRDVLPNSDDVIYLEDDAVVMFRYENSWCLVRLPYQFNNEESALAMSKYEILKIAQE